MSTNGKVLITGANIRGDLLQPLLDAGLGIVSVPHTMNEAELGDHLAECVAYLKGGGEFASGAALARGKSLKVVAFNGMGYESSVDVEAARRQGLAITITHDTLNDAMAELTLGLVLAGVRRIHENASDVERGVQPDMSKRRDLAALRVGVVGLGGSGTRICEVLRQGFGAAVNYYSRTQKPEIEARLGVGYRELDALVAESDVLIVIVAGSPTTWGMFDKARIGRAKPGQIFVNVARPAIVDADALLWGLTEGPLSYAAYDGFYKEPADLVSQLMALAPKKLMVTSHIGSLTHDARDAMLKKAVRSILNILERGEDPDRVV